MLGDFQSGDTLNSNRVPGSVSGQWGREGIRENLHSLTRLYTKVGAAEVEVRVCACVCVLGVQAAE